MSTTGHTRQLSLPFLSRLLFGPVSRVVAGQIESCDRLARFGGCPERRLVGVTDEKASNKSCTQSR
ncbi:MAG: hypothetical protein J07HR59_01697 [Halorubrum sp. J07HR59]|nr:MAG: hypothetical protein J07HR59_01697 [Halorubrum sp. J07HR59]